MRRILVCTGILGSGTAIVFALAALTASLFPNGTVLGTSWNGPLMDQRVGWDVMPMPAPVVIEGPAPVPGFDIADDLQPLPGDRTLELAPDWPGTDPVP